MTFGFRLRFFSNGPRIDSDAESIDIELSDGRTVKLAPTWPDTKLRDARDLKLSGPGFATRDEAQRCGERLRSAVLKSMAELRTGFDLGKDRPTSWTSDDVKEAISRGGGVRMHDNVHGLYVFEEQPPSRFFLMQATGSVQSSPSRYIDEWKRQYDASPQLSPKEAFGLELYAMAHAEPSTRARFVALATVVEALAAGAMRSEKGQQLIDSFMETFMKGTRESDLDPSERRSLEGGLLDLKRGSIGAACRRYIEAALGKDATKEFDRLYDIRSKLVHTGVYDDTALGDELSKLDALVSRLLAPLGVSTRS